MGMSLIVIGIGWALLGVLNLITGISKLQSAGYSDAWLGFAVIFNMFAFVLPGLGLAGIGSLVRRRKRGSRRGSAAMQPTSDVKQCPFCAETIKREATICRYCQRELPVNVPLGSDQLTAITDRPTTKDAKHMSGIALTATLLAGLLGWMVVWWGIMLGAAGGYVQDVAIGLYVVTHEGLTAVGIPTPDPKVVTRYFLEAPLPSKPPAKVAVLSTPETGPLLEVQSWQCDKEYRYIFVRGEVKNISSQPLKNVTAVGEFRTKSEELVKSENALLDYNPILPGQTSPFKAGGTDNPQISRCGVSFKYLLGGTVNFTERKKGK